jgi:hypothetical protein
MSPKDYLELWETNPRLMAILLEVQGHIRTNLRKQVKDTNKTR